MVLEQLYRQPSEPKWSGFPNPLATLKSESAGGGAGGSPQKFQKNTYKFKKSLFKMAFYSFVTKTQKS